MIFQRELYAACPLGGEDLPIIGRSCGVLAAILLSEVEDRCVSKIRHINPELQELLFGNREFFGQAEVSRLVSGTIERAYSAIAESSGRRRRYSSGIQEADSVVCR